MKIQSSSRQFDSIFRRTFVCPSCSTLRLSDSPRPQKRLRTERNASTLSTTAINGKRPIPTQNQPLYEALNQVKSKASTHVNLSRLQLALQGLESELPVTRIAILGLNVQDVARRIARLLLADALENEHPWERQITDLEGSRGILIRYGQPQNTNIPQRSTLPILQIPSPTLEKLNIELLVTAVNAENDNTSVVPTEAFLAPAVGVPTDFDGRQVTVNQPVHSALFVAQGFEELVKAIELLSSTRFQSEEDKEAVTLVANLPDNNSQSRQRVLVSDVAKAENGLKAIRESVSKATVYEHGWLASGMPQISNWLAQEIRSDQEAQVPPVIVQRLISSLLVAATTSIEQRAEAARQKSRLLGLDTVATARIEKAIDDFSRAAHQELQSGLASAWSSRNWRKLSWYKLFWRVDDVGLIVSDLVTNSWLPKTERAAYEISGRLTQIEISPTMAEQAVPETEHRTAFEPETAQATLIDPAPPLLATATTSPSNEITLPQMSQPVVRTSSPTQQPTIQMKPAPLPVPITSAISSARKSYLIQQITSLTTTAQQLVFRTLSISGFSAGLSALTYVSAIAPTLYEAGTIFAVGTVFALYRMQTGWQYATKMLETGLFEEGRDAIRQVVERMKELVQVRVAEKGVVDPVEKEMLEDAGAAVMKAKNALQELQRK